MNSDETNMEKEGNRMNRIEIRPEWLTPSSTLTEKQPEQYIFQMAEEGGGFHLPMLKSCAERFFIFEMEVLEDHSLPMEMQVFVQGEEDPAFTLRFGVLPRMRTTVCIDLEWMNAEELFPETFPGGLKTVCHGRRVQREEIADTVLTSRPSHHPVRILFRDFRLSSEYPAAVPGMKKLIDQFGQYIPKEWPNKIHQEEELRKRLSELAAPGEPRYPSGEWTRYGGWKQKKLQEGTGFFSRCRTEDRWWLVDPEGYAFFSLGVDCVRPEVDGRIDAFEKCLEWLPSEDDERYGGMYRNRVFNAKRRQPRLFSFSEANLYRAFGENWFPAWQHLMERQLKGMGINTLGNWSSPRILGEMDIPYVTQLPEFPSTQVSIFRDFPDVFSEEYAQSAKRCALALEKSREDPLMIGYFLRNEPSWAFVDGVNLAEEVLFHPERTACREKLISWLKEKYGSIDRFNAAWHAELSSFDDLYQPMAHASKRSVQAREDTEEFSRRMLREYVRIPVQACREMDPHHMILGMRWAWISQADLATGWELFDAFSINCYATDPTESIQRVVDLGVDLPILIGEFHFGALDAGLTATGLEGVQTQQDRGSAFRNYCNAVAAHPCGVGCHYFQCYDQFALGRFDGENYNIGIFDICSQPYPEMQKEIAACAGEIYSIASGEKKREWKKTEPIPMIAY